MTKYLFDPDDLQSIVKMHLDVPLDQRFDDIIRSPPCQYFSLIYIVHIIVTR